MTAPTAPAPTPPSLPPQCLLYVDGARYADGSPGHDTDPVALSGLSVTWGRDTILDQPSPSTCALDVLDVAGGQSFRPALYVGARLDVVASTTIYGDPTVPTMQDPGFESGVFHGSVVGGAATVVGTDPHTGTNCLRVDPAVGAAAVTVTLPPAPYSANPAAWDPVPRAAAGQTWQGHAWVKLPQLLAPVQAAYVTVVAFTHPDGRTPLELAPRVPVTGGAGTWQHVVLDDVVPPVDCWLGVRVRVQPPGPTWGQTPPDVTWDTAPAVAWDDVGAVYVDDADVYSPPAGALRQGAVFSGRVTDLESKYDPAVAGTLLHVTAQNHLAELGNRYVGDAPWPVQTAADRVAAIVAAAGQPAVTATVDPGVAGRLLSYLDVDAQPAAGLLARVAQSVGGVLWCPTSVAAQTALRVEDVDARPPLFLLVEAGGVIVIELNPDAAAVDLDACLFDLDPVRWGQDSTDTATQVAVGWQDQGAEVPPKPAGRTETATDEVLTASRGRFRVGVSTDLATQADARTLAGTLLARLSAGGWRVTGLTWELAATDLLDGPALARVMQILDGTTRPGLPILLTGLPAWSPIAPADTVPLYLEGGTFRNDRGAWTLELTTSSAVSQGAAAVRWDDQPAGWTWDAYDPAISWDDLAGVGI